MIVLYILVGLIIVGADQWIKQWAVENLISESGAHLSKEFIKLGDTRIIDLTYTENTGAAFGSLDGMKVFLIGLPILIAILGIVTMSRFNEKSKFFSWCVLAVISGGVSNLIDRIRIGYVVDYIEIKLFDFAIFNFADCCVCVGVALMLIYVLFINKDLFETKRGA